MMLNLVLGFQVQGSVFSDSGMHHFDAARATSKQKPEKQRDRERERCIYVYEYVHIYTYICFY